MWSSSAFAQNNTIFGPNVYVFSTSNSVSSINSTLATLAGNAQFSTNRYAVFFEPGTYTGVESAVGFYESIAGLGQTPNAVNINQGYLQSNQTINGNDTQNFWRSMENMEMTTPGGGTLQWGVSQGASIRRMLINNPVELTDSGCNFSSGGFIANTQVTGQVNSCSQQQWYTRNSSLGSWTGGSWNMVFSGVSGAPEQSNPFGGGGHSYTVLATTPVSREKPFLYMDGSGNYWVFSPSYGTNTSGTTWANGGVGNGEAGTSLPISSFLIATPSTSLATINAALASGQNLILTPGIYQYSGSINVTNANTVVLGLGYADIVPQSGTAALTVADVDGVQLAGFLIDAGPINSPVLLQIGVNGAPRVNHVTNPTSISDVHFRIGGATLGTCAEATEIDSDNVIIDNMWTWRADHGNAGTVGWTLNVCNNGLVVNGDYVVATGLAVEHYEAEQVVWNGEGGETIFYQSEMPYDVPNQSAWMNGSVEGYASYNVAPTVATHSAYGLGVYSVFNQGVAIVAKSGIAAPVAAGVTFHDSVSVTLAAGQIDYNIASNNTSVDNAGTTAGPNSYVTSWGGTNGQPFLLRTPNASASVRGGSSTTLTITTIPGSDPAPTISFSVTGLPSGATPSFNPSVVNGAGSATLTINASGGVAPGTYPITVVGTSGTETSSVSLTLTVNSATSDYTITSAPSAFTAVAGEIANYTVAFFTTNYLGNVALSVTGSPAGATATFSSATVGASNTTSTLSISTLGTTPVGAYPLTITATDGSVTHSTSAVLIITSLANACIQQLGDFWISGTLPTQTGTFTTEWDASPSTALNNTNIGLSLGAQTAFTGLAVAARFNPTGQIDARNGGAFVAASTINYAPGVKYHFRAVVNVPANTYSIYVTPQGEPELTVGTNYAFRSEQAGIKSIDHWDAISEVGLVQICNLVIDTPPTPGSVQLTTSAQLLPLGDGSYQAVVTVTNNGTGTAQDVLISGATLGSAAGSTLPVSLGNIQPGAAAIAPVSFPSSAGTPGSLALERYTGTYTGGSFGGTFRVTLPTQQQ
jgi:hypothetical protein